MKYIVTTVGILVIGAGIWYFFFYNTEDTGPDNLPTAEEVERMQEIEESSSQVAPNAVPGAGVRAPGTLPKPEPATTTATATIEAETEIDPQP